MYVPVLAGRIAGVTTSDISLAIHDWTEEVVVKTGVLVGVG